MIGKLKGIVESISANHVILDVQGVGYAVTCSANTLRQLPIGQGAALFIETHVREDAISLFGFATAEEQDWFKLLTTVQGVGAKVALSILSSISPDKIAAIIAAQDKSAMTEADGVGPKLALRIVTELKDKVPAFIAGHPSKQLGTGAIVAVPSGGAQGDAVSALINLGYRRAEAFAAVSTVSRQNPSAKLDDLIRLGLAELTRGSNAA